MTWDDVFTELDRRRGIGLEVLPYPHPSLLRPAVVVRQFAEIPRLARRMFEVMYDRRGVGLAAPQLGLPWQVFVCNHTVQAKSGSPEVQYDPKAERVFVNPVVAPKLRGSAPPKLTVQTEGCLSLPGLFRDVVRYHTVTFEGQEAAGQPVKGEYNGLLARIIQHETDHLRCTLFPDRLDAEQAAGVASWLAYLTAQYASLPDRCENLDYAALEALVR